MADHEKNEGQEPEANSTTDNTQIETPKQEEKQSVEETPETPEVKDESKDERTDDLPEWVLRERKQLRDEAAEWRVKLRETEQAKDAEIKELQGKLAQIEFEGLKRAVAEEVGLPASAAGRINGSTKEELEADAKELFKLLAVRSPRKLSGGLTPQDGTTDTTDPRERARRVRRGR